MKLRDKGFTLIEMVVAIVIIVIVSVVALPRFLGISSDARSAIMESVAIAMRDSADQIQIQTFLPDTPKVLVADESTETLTVYDVTVEELSTTVRTYNGYVDGHWENAWRHILNVGQDISWTSVNDTCTKNALCGVGNQTTAPSIPTPTNPNNGLVLVWPENFKLSDLCYAYYNNPEDGSVPTIGAVTTGC
ncbi:prepilin-type N-terminal cleavage/methylation domain-containing protein [Vibrio sp. D404a]|uniref:prepilin-type N-terminal cleavage/methylation domain-containing protein n=1 Tax=unclassified Vibrio TaxID=2614977 RepID=UPI0025556252|nr:MULTISPECIES: prepilin-type N-terminal cleavage/methylation domain-containing protein [unclassified Vibrio]MDK9739420.1 prepilin-type N-terminal cleavage/methylation domain-containing protein [Vibrio sp. D404a]MDK9799017.1 prepilin-type N-terminal cleavage/methylation domain-containing protein [Vibrio sp. D449a]